MTTEVVLEHLPGEKYRITGSGQFAVTTEGETREEAVANFQKIAARLATTTEILSVEVPIAPDGATYGNRAENNADLLASLGKGARYPEDFKNEFLASIERNRQEENVLVTD